MTEIAPWYPPTPPNVPANLAVPSARYRARVFVVLACLILFFLLYLGLMAGSLVLLRHGLQIPMQREDGKDNFIWKGLCIVGPALLFLFLLKGLFKRQSSDPPFRVEVREGEHPRLFAFLRQLCAETGAPFPHRVYLTTDVNAAVFYHRSVLNLVWPTPKNLVLGLGLVNALNLSEFKAVLAHELGHFGQKSMKVGPYVYTANKIMADIVYSRDWLDDFLAGWRRLDLRISWPAWGFSGVVWVLRQILAGFFKAVNFLHSALSRQMEFNADLVAVSAAGGDAVVHSLARVGFANTALDQAFSDLGTAADHRLYTTDLYFHYEPAVRRLRQLRKDPKLGEPPASDDPDRPARVFEPGEDEGVPLMWASHPSNHDREQNVRRHNVRAALDGRPAWVLFDNPEAVRQTVTRRFYEEVVHIPADARLTPAEQVQAFIDEEHAATTYDPRYQGLYDGRLIDCGNVAELAQRTRSQPLTEEELTRTYEGLYGERLTAWLAEHNRRSEEADRLRGYLERRVPLPSGRISFRGESYKAQEIPGLLEKVEGELEEEGKWLAELDRQVFQVHSQMAGAVDEALARELKERYEFHLEVQDIFRHLLGQAGRVQAGMEFLSGKREVEAEAFAEIRTLFREAHQVLSDSLKRAAQMPLPALRNLPAGQPLDQFLLRDKQLVWGLGAFASTLPGEWLGKFLAQFGEVQDKIRRIHFKSLGGILALQEDIARRWLTRQEPVSLTVGVNPEGAKVGRRASEPGA